MARFSASHSRTCNHAAITSLLLLIVLCLAWELWLAPLRPGGSWLALKALPLLAPLFGILHARRYTHQWASLLILLYLLEGLTRAFSDNGMMQLLAIVEVVLALVFFMATLCFARATARQHIKAGD
ncbi:MAG: DUF2069 domain-containing protein [Rhodocyclaceae bacterium]|jgi:uncharacterized membrane protein|nr:DUF2069 domain-containing protein [Rhodocyclaceae bacterium]MDP3030586.1 DUF2069 domain-containing protein [Rhodocyclaceae bacterium]